MTPVYELLIEAEFSAAHRLREYDGACEKLHGHNWRVEMAVVGEKLNNLGMIMDFSDLKIVLGCALDAYDHTYLNDLDCFKDQNPTTENLSRLIFEGCTPQMPEGVRVKSVTVWESPRCGAVYSQ
jgi:6-pyruvoyltetrahydropterin/6-carboxytetrahydropterin synthase